MEVGEKGKLTALRASAAGRKIDPRFYMAARCAVFMGMGMMMSCARVLRTGAPFGMAMVACAGPGLSGVFTLIGASLGYVLSGGVEWVKSNAGDPEIAKLTEKAKKKFAGTEIMGKKLGIIGLGAIGVRVANAAKNLGMDVYGYDPYLSVDAAWSLSSDVKHVTNVDDIYSKCDIITVHVPALDATKGMINAAAIAKMKKGVILLNLARDILANEADVLSGINSGKICRYVTDFPNSTIAGHDGCIVIPHLGASTEESEDNCAVKAVIEMMNYLENGNINNSVNYPNCDMGICVKPRIAIFHKNIANMISQFTNRIGSAGYNISDMTNKSKGDLAYTMIDCETEITDDLIKSLSEIDGVYRVRVVKKSI